MVDLSRLGRRRILIGGARYFLAGIFLFSAVGKLISSRDFLAFISSFSFYWLDPSVILVIVVAMELTIGILLLNRRTTQTGAISALVTVLIFSGVLMYSHIINPDQSCGCFGELSSGMSAEVGILRNTLLAVASVMLIYRPEG